MHHHARRKAAALALGVLLAAGACSDDGDGGSDEAASAADDPCARSEPARGWFREEVLDQPAEVDVEVRVVRDSDVADDLADAVEDALPDGWAVGGRRALDDTRDCPIQVAVRAAPEGGGASVVVTRRWLRTAASLWDTPVSPERQVVEHDDGSFSVLDEVGSRRTAAVVTSDGVLTVVVGTGDAAPALDELEVLARRG